VPSVLPDDSDWKLPQDEDLLAWIAGRAARVTADESLTGSVGIALERQHGGGWDWWAVTELVNPAQTYWRRVHPNMDPDPAIRAKLEYGTRIHDMASGWFRRMPEYAASEGSVDGAPAGISGVKGRIDFRLGRSIIELKTTDQRIASPEDVIARNPQDLEQLVLYALMTFRGDESHKLVYFNEALPGAFVAFNVRLRSQGPLKQYFLARRGALERAIEMGDASRLGRCRYLDTGCDYRLNEICPCDTLGALDTGALSGNVELARDSAFEDELRHARESAPFPPSDRIGLWDLFTPRRAFMRATVTEFEGSSADDDYELRKFLERRFVSSELAGEPFDIVIQTRDNRQVKLLGRGLSARTRDTTSEGTNEAVLPFLLRVSRRQVPHEPAEVPDVYKAQLGAQCAIRSSPTGLLAIEYPSHAAALKCFRVRFDSLEEIRNRLGRRFAQLQRAIVQRDATDLPKCPSWMIERCSEHCLCVDRS
jgi:hypothetical protein